MVKRHDPATLKGRIGLAANEIGGVDAFSSASKINRTTIYDWINGRSEPTVSKLAQIAKFTGSEIDWLVSGKGQGPVSKGASDADSSDNSPAVAPGFDIRLLGRCTDAIAKLYKQLGIRLPDSDLGELSGELYNDVASSGVTDFNEQLAAIKVLIARHRRKLLGRSDTNSQAKRPTS